MAVASPTGGRVLSHSEVETLLDCQGKWDFRYGKRLAGSSLRPKVKATRLREGGAWGRGVAALHETGDLRVAGRELLRALHLDANEQRAARVYVRDEHKTMARKLLGILLDYNGNVERITLIEPEHELLVGVPSRGGKRRSTRFRFVAYLDGLHRDDDGRLWLVEFKLRDTLSSSEAVARMPQLRRYAWAWREATGEDIAGAIVDERVNGLPSPVRLNNDGRPSKVQSCSASAYVDACAAVGVVPDDEVLNRLRAKSWQARHRVLFLPGELDETGRELTSVARMLTELESGRSYPVRHPSPRRCPGCFARDICSDPRDRGLVEALYERVPAKVDRLPEEG